MNKEFIPYEQALKLKELGFNEPCIAHFRGGEITLEPCLSGWLSELECCKNFEENGESYFKDGDCSAPLKSQAFRWFRGNNDDYEEAELDALIRLIELAKNIKTNKYA